MDRKGSIKVKDLNLYYGALHALKNVSMAIEPNQIVAIDPVLPAAGNPP